ncbi:hypothetical protein [Cytobacillus sp.]|uniref:hypothetical protein n=1 Tax=Cytobacillus sp. TaxID=2675269 RepID=UPI0028BDD347|nr:hypothetical protein [Cytobacillus sp.]
MIVIFNKTNLQIVGTPANNETVEQAIEKDVIPNFGGKANEYDFIEVHYEYFKLEVMEGTVIAVEIEPPPLPEPKPSELDLLRQENQMLQASVMELSTIVATQEASQKILEQSVLELSTLLTTT